VQLPLERAREEVLTQRNHGDGESEAPLIVTRSAKIAL
jgi:hypothetical protein